MMQHNNSSSSSLSSSKDKDLPPIPSTPTFSSPSRGLLADPDAGILQTKTLKRKNFKKLSLEASPVNENKYDNRYTLDKEDISFESSSLRQRRLNVRPAPLLNLSQQSHPQVPNRSQKIQSPLSPSYILNQTASYNRHVDSYNNSPVNVNSSNRNIDPDSTAATALIMDQISNLELSTAALKHTVTPLNRKRQTVISSISPTKSSASSPLDPPYPASTTKVGQDAESAQISLQNPISFTSSADSSSPIATTSSFQLNNADLVTLKNLGSGNSGTVSKILHVPTQKIMAKKIIHIDSKTVIQTQIIRELRILHECQSPYIIEFYGAFLNTNNTIVICMEYCNCGSLDKILPLCQNKQFPLPVLKKLAYAILSGLSYLYTTHKIIHRDIKPSNVLMTHKGEFKLCDFGVSRELTNSLAMADTFVGTSTYMSPERIQGLNYGVKSDIWSMGLMLLELAKGVPVWSDDDGDNSSSDHGGPEGILDLLQRIVNETPPTLIGKINPVTKEPYDALLCSFIDSCLIKDDNMRKSPWDLLEDTDGFLKGVVAGEYEKDVKSWAKGIRKLHKDKSEGEK
ncbi:Serine/threonine-protein kinase STE7 [Scheffersomyces xylosifermentans]|uniref:Serine/threonine-protein kinase STE7 n=1 Tax=Scheffersomyces xylosifermentans TaxID=1304137 RepID=UPI00315CDA5C